jgi:hypothetical protein
MHPGKTKWLTVRIGVVLLPFLDRDRESQWTPNALGHRIRMWWASQAPTQASDEYMTETGAHKLSIDGWSHEFIWRRGDII